MVMVIAGLNVAEAAPVTVTLIAPEVEATAEKPAGTGTPWTPEKVGVESEGAVKVNEGVEVSTFVVPSAFFAVMIVLGGSDTETVPRYPGVPGAVVTLVVVGPVVALPSALAVAAKELVVDGSVGGGALPPPPPPQPMSIIMEISTMNIPVYFPKLSIILFICNLPLFR
jgi:hypothetical protein